MNVFFDDKTNLPRRWFVVMIVLANLIGWSLYFFKKP